MYAQTSFIIIIIQREPTSTHIYRQVLTSSYTHHPLCILNNNNNNNNNNDIYSLLPVHEPNPMQHSFSTIPPQSHPIVSLPRQLRTVTIEKGQITNLVGHIGRHTETKDGFGTPDTLSFIIGPTLLSIGPTHETIPQLIILGLLWSVTLTGPIG